MHRVSMRMTGLDVRDTRDVVLGRVEPEVYYLFTPVISANSWLSLVSQGGNPMVSKNCV